WEPVGEQKFDAASGVTARLPQAGQVNLLAIGKDGKVYTNTRQQEKAWQGWSALGSLKLPAKASVEVLVRRDQRIDLFAVGQDGKACATFRDKKMDWQKWIAIGGGAWDAGSGITAIEHASIPGRVNAVAVGKDRRVYATFRTEEESWQPWSLVNIL